MPNQPKTPGRHVRVEDPLWEKAMEIAHHRGENLSAHVIRPALVRYVEDHLDELP